jgi:hypothetical protein
MRVRLAGGGGGGGKEAACMRPTGKTESEAGAFQPWEARAGRAGGVGAWLCPPREQFFFFFTTAQRNLIGDWGNRTLPIPGKPEK